MDDGEARERFGRARVARLATVRPDGAPHLVACTFALDGDVVHTAVDAKPKRHQRLQRLANLRQDPRCAVLVDHYDDDWSQLWWIRADGEATIVDDPPADHPGLRRLADRYAPYREQPPGGPLIIVTVRRWSGWSAT